MRVKRYKLSSVKLVSNIDFSFAETMQIRLKLQR
jgi:hypothetical protein